MNYLLDTNACITYLRGKNPVLLQKFGQHPLSDMALCSVSTGELRHGAERSKNPPAEYAKVDAFVARFTVLPFDEAAARVFARIRHFVMSRGQTIGAYDFQIAAIALANDLTLVTHNTHEFGRVPGLRWEDWEVP
ncbi:MAG: type II toxin-antitoxin system VapC family toxin [Gemmataceae bacterium]|nr:type II toxin-antitoxin system VapC family toxin [Gemmataceae bacterium]